MKALFWKSNTSTSSFTSTKSSSATSVSKSNSRRRPLEFPPPDNDERYYGFENYGNTCYCNSVIQALYYIPSFRSHILLSPHKTLDSTSIIACLAELFERIAGQKKRIGYIGPKKVIHCIRRENEMFKPFVQQDAHEFFLFLINNIDDYITSKNREKEKEKGKEKLIAGTKSPSLINSVTPDEAGIQSSSSPHTSWIQDIFAGKLANETKCLTCENISSRFESFLDLSVEVERGHSLASSLAKFSQVEMMKGKEKFYCDHCEGLQEAEKRLRIEQLPQVLTLHLKRFKYLEKTGRFMKLSYHIPFPFTLRFESGKNNLSAKTVAFELVSIVVHVGSGPNQGHYIALVKSGEQWIAFDDDVVQPIEEKDVENVFGSLNDESVASAETGYILFYKQEISSLSSS